MGRGGREKEKQQVEKRNTEKEHKRSLKAYTPQLCGGWILEEERENCATVPPDYASSDYNHRKPGHGVKDSQCAPSQGRRNSIFILITSGQAFTAPPVYKLLWLLAAPS